MMHKLLLWLQILLPCCWPTQPEIEPTTKQEEFTDNDYHALSDESDDESEIIDLSTDQRVIGCPIPVWLLKKLQQKNETNHTFIKNEMVICDHRDYLKDSNFRYRASLEKTKNYDEINIRYTFEHGVSFEKIKNYDKKNNLYTLSSEKQVSPDKLLKIPALITDCQLYNKIEELRHLYTNLESPDYKTPIYSLITQKNNLCLYCNYVPVPGEYELHRIFTDRYKADDFKNSLSWIMSYFHENQQIKSALYLKKIDGIIIDNLMVFGCYFKDTTSQDIYYYDHGWNCFILLPAHHNLKPINIKKEFHYPTLFANKNECAQKILKEKKSTDLFFEFNEKK